MPMPFERLRFFQLTLFVLGLLVVTAIFPNALLLRALMALLFLNTLFVTLSPVGHGPMARGALLGVWSIGTLAMMLGALHAAGRFDRAAILAGQGAYLILIVSGVAATLRYVLTTRRVSLDIIFAAVVAYLLMGIGFSMVYVVLLTIDPQAFNVGAVPALGGDVAPEPQLLYFSFVTMATLGYGDITPQLPLPRILAALQAVVGQFYIAVVVAWLVSRYVMEPGQDDEGRPTRD